MPQKNSFSLPSIWAPFDAGLAAAQGVPTYSVTENGVWIPVETWLITIPLHDNDGVPFPKAIIESILAEITREFSGLTGIPCKGRWSGPDGECVDKNLLVMVYVPLHLTKKAEAYFARKKVELMSSLRQEKIQVNKNSSNKESSNGEFLLFDEFFKERGIPFDVNADGNTKRRLAEQAVSRLDLEMQRKGHEALAIRRDREAMEIPLMKVPLGDPEADGGRRSRRHAGAADPWDQLFDRLSLAYGYAPSKGGLGSQHSGVVGPRRIVETTEVGGPPTS